MIKIRSKLIDFHDEICCFNGYSRKSAIASAIEHFNRDQELEELKKTKREEEIIELARQAVISFQAEYGRKKILNIPLDHVHVLKKGSVGTYNASFATGASSSRAKTVIVERSSNDAKFALTVFHELFHTYSYSCPLYKDGRMMNFISGVSIKAPCFKRQVFFEIIEEAVISFMERKFFKEYIVPNNDLFVKPIGKNPFPRTKELEALEWFIGLSKRKIGKSRKDLMNFFVRAQVNGWVDRTLDFYELIFGEGHVKWMMKRNKNTAVGTNQQLFMLY